MNLAPSNFSSFIEHLSQQAIDQGDKCALCFDRNVALAAGGYSYSQLDVKAKAIAYQLTSRVPVGSRVLVLSDDLQYFVEGLLGSLYAGMAAALIYPPTNKHYLQHMLKACIRLEPSAILIGPGLKERLLECLSDDIDASWLRELAIDAADGSVTTPWGELYCCQLQEVNLSLSIYWQMPSVKKHDLAFIQYTSGSTSSPKGVMITHQNVMSNQGVITETYRLNSNSRIAIWLPPYHDMGLSSLLHGLYLGAATYLLPTISFIRSPYGFMKLLSEQRIHATAAPNFSYLMCVQRVKPSQRDNLDLRYLSTVLNGAEPVQLDIIKQFCDYFRPAGFDANAFFPSYGLAEATCLVSARKGVNTIVDKDHNVNVNVSLDGKISELVSCGTPMVDILICDPESLTVCPDGSMGEVLVSGDSVSPGYWRERILSQAILTREVSGHEGKTYLRTGDLGFYYQQELFICGRMKEMMIINGKNYFPQDIERTVRAAITTITAQACLAFSVMQEGCERLMMVLANDKSHRLTEGELQLIKREVYAQHGVQVSTFLLVSHRMIPKTDSGKLKRNQCKEDFLRQGYIGSAESCQVIDA